MEQVLQQHLQVQKSIKAVGDESKNKFTIAGTDLDGNSFLKLGPTAGQTAVGSKVFKTISSVTPTSSTSGNRNWDGSCL